MEQPINLYCPNCNSQLNHETAPQSEGYAEGYANWKAITCPCCNFGVENSSKPCADWAELEAILISNGAYTNPPEQSYHGKHFD